MNDIQICLSDIAIHHLASYYGHRGGKGASKRTGERMRELVAGNDHLFQQPDFIKENSQGVRELVAGSEHLFQQPEFIKENRDGKVNRHATTCGLIVVHQHRKENTKIECW